MPFPFALSESCPLPELLAELARADSTGDFQTAPFREPLDPARAPTLDLPHAVRPSQVADHPEPAPDRSEVAIPDVALETYLGAGQQGWVYAGRVRSTGMPVAVKILRGDVMQAGGRGAQEAIILAKLCDPSITRVFQLQPSGAFWVVIMEFVQGESLAEARLSPCLLRRCFGRLAGALLTMAEARIVHRDIKPANIIVRQRDHSPVLVDFGVAVDLTNPLWKPEAGLSGTPLFLAPEAFAGVPPAAAWDAYALGMTALVTLSDHGYPRRLSLGELARAKVSGEFDEWIAASLRHIEDAELRAWCRRLTHPDPNQRLSALQTARAWLAAAEAA